MPFVQIGICQLTRGCWEAAGLRRTQRQSRLALQGEESRLTQLSPHAYVARALRVKRTLALSASYPFRSAAKKVTCEAAFIPGIQAEGKTSPTVTQARMGASSPPTRTARMHETGPSGRMGPVAGFL